MSQLGMVFHAQEGPQAHENRLLHAIRFTKQMVATGTVPFSNKRDSRILPCRAWYPPDTFERYAVAGSDNGGYPCAQPIYRTVQNPMQRVKRSGRAEERKGASLMQGRFSRDF
ncbi:hypothetical protein SDC9_116825 [bioreactor metagenome]|uniref:Uncharacterized protein n=1 Tax=bioreactor metagenome TaxID=1076179 RepID=A0A645BXH1_9ZZZZ